MKRNKLLILFLISLLGFSCNQNTITLESLLNDMLNPDNISYFNNSFNVKQFSSFDRKSVGPDKENWWANADYTQFLREEKNKGRREFVMFDHEGPGAIVRFWMTFAGNGATESILRFYIDGDDEPVIEGNAPEVLSGGILAPEPLSISVSPETEYERRGHNLYLPIPFSESCKVTIECDSVHFQDGYWRPSLYYNINYREYAEGTKVESFSKEILERANPLISKTTEELINPAKISEIDFVKKSGELAGSDELSIKLMQKNTAINGLKVSLDAKNINQALRSTVLAISFDGKQTVWVPAGDFFGTGYQVFLSKTRFTEVDSDGTLSSNWIMPFKDSVKVSLINYGDQNVKVGLEVTPVKYKWKKSSMYFGSAWHEYYQKSTAKDEHLENHQWHYDVNYVELKGKGIYVGDALTVFNTVDAWWGEGDEKIYVDGEYFPSSIGTGTEDYYGYAWCRPEKFSTPFIAQPTGAGNFHPGMSVNMRYRILDAIPFSTEIKSDIEMWHWVKTKVNYAMTSYWYVFPDFESNIEPDVEAVKNPVAMVRSDIYKPIVENGFVEGEHLEVFTVSGGEVSTQSLSDIGWSGDSQLWWRFGKLNDELIAKFILPEDGKYVISARLTKAIDYGIIKIELNGEPVLNSFNGFYNDGVIAVNANLGTHFLSKGENILKIIILGKDNKAKDGNMVGIDLLEFEKL
ncbi:MAG: DUF2961 domain-containing protein [Prolixibacteraceae bacterium]|nr:DUF2961 domain-containing protein [Prolixibacteraceae bacterium]MBN2775167.1 DUF2961 domain-containing protein [Prolixibacteraceae bacterium]